MKIPFVPSDFQILDFLEDVTFQNEIKVVVHGAAWKIKPLLFIV